MSKPRIKEVAGAGWELAKTWSAAAAFVGGLGLDILTLGRIDDPTNVLLQGIYLVLAGPYYASARLSVLSGITPAFVCGGSRREG